MGFLLSIRVGSWSNAIHPLPPTHVLAPTAPLSPSPSQQQDLQRMCQSAFQSNMVGELHSDRHVVMCLTTLYSDPALHVTFNLFLSPCVYLTESVFRRLEQ